jgi:hypothetical protein
LPEAASPRRERTEEVLLRVLEVCRAAEAQASDPFQVDVAALFDRLKPLLPKLESPDELRMDAEAVWRIARIVYGQGNWLHSRAALLYFDPLVTLMKIEAMGVDDLAEALGRAWRPVVEAEAVSPGQVAAGSPTGGGGRPTGPAPRPTRPRASPSPARWSGPPWRRWGSPTRGPSGRRCGVCAPR